MTDSKIIIGADVSGVSTGVNEAKLSLKSLADSAEAQGRRAGSGLNKVGSGAGRAAAEVEKAAKKQDRATRSIVSSIEREIAAREAGGRNTAGYYEALAKRRGADISAVQKYTAELKKQENQLKLTNITVGQYNNALRMVPAQMTDIVTQLAGGQNPFLIAIQQGGQLRDSFGGFGNMMKGLGNFITPARLAIGGLVGGVGALAYAMYQGAEESRAYEKALILTGNQAGTTAGYLQKVAAEVGRATGGYGEAKEAVIALASSGKVGAENFADFTQSIVLQSKAAGQSVDDLAEKYVEIAEDPLKAVVKLSAVYQSMTADVYAQVKALKAQGREQEAVTLVQKKYADESEVMSRRVLENLGWIEKGWIAVKDASVTAWEEMKAIGRTAPIEQQLAKAKDELRQLESFGDTLVGRSLRKDGGEIDQKKRQIRLLEQQLAGEKELAFAQSAKKKREQETIAAMEASGRLAEEMRSKEERFREKEREAEKSLQVLRRAGRKEEAAELARNINLMKRRHAEELAAESKRGKRGSGRAGTPLDNLSANQKKLYALAQKYGEDPAKWLALYEIESASGRKMLNRQSGATGHFQIMPQFLRDYGVSRAGANDLSASFLAVRKHHARHSARLKTLLGRELTAGEYYLGHQQGWGGATALLANPDKNVVDALATIMSRRKAGAAVVQNGGRTSMTARQFANMWISKADKLQQQYVGKGIGSMDFSGFDGIGGFSETAFDKWLQKFTEGQVKARIEAELTGKAFGKTITEQLALLSNPEYETFSEQQKQTALEMAKQADVQADINRLSEKYRDILKDLNSESERDFDDDLFELSLIGKKTEEIERLTAARRYDKIIKDAMNDGASADVIKRLQTSKLDNDGRIEERQRLEREEQAKRDADWLGGIKDGMDAYRNSFDSMRDSMAAAVTDTLGGMTDELADFVATGKADFRGFTVSVLQDLSKLLMKMAIFNAMKSFAGGMSGQGGIIGQIGSYLGGAVAQADGGAWDKGVQFYANGGVFANKVVSKPTMFAHGGGFGVMGEAGPEAIMPLTRGANGKLGVMAHGVGGGNGVVVNMTVNVEGGGENTQDDVRKGVEAGMVAAMRQIADQRISESWRVGNISYQMAKGV